MLKNEDGKLQIDAKEFVRLLDKWQTLRGIARNTGHTYHAVRKAYHEALREEMVGELPRSPVASAEDHKVQAIIEGNIKMKKMPRFDLPEKGKIKRYIFTSAQNNTKMHEQLWTNLLALSEHYNAEICVARFFYVKSGLGAKGDKSMEKSERSGLYDPKIIEWDERLIPHLVDDRVQVAPGLVWCGEMNILPTADRPLSGLQVYTGRNSGIFPHAKIAMESVASNLHEATKFNYTTGAVTVRNYIQKKAGLKAEFHHCYGALMVEVNSDGDWWCRQLNAEDNGTIYDLDVKVRGGNVTTDNRVEAINWGDIHVDELDMSVAEAAWGDDGMFLALKPKHQFCHDVLDFKPRSGHHVKRTLPYDRLRAWTTVGHSVEEEVDRVANFLNEISTRWCKTVVVDSNHHRHFDEWLMTSDWRNDIGENTIFLLEAQLEYAHQVLENPKDPVNILKWAIDRADYKPINLEVLNQDDPYIICDSIECGMHGHLGPNGTRGSPTAFARMGRRTNLGHTHVAGIWDGIYYAGTCSHLSMDYNKGPSSWSHSHIITYENGKRAIVTMWNGRWRA